MEKLSIANNITAAVVNYKTLDLIQKSIFHFRKFYPLLPLIVIDGSSYTESSKWIFQFAVRDKNTTTVFNTFNFHHGPSLHVAIQLAQTNYVFIFDSDTFIIKNGLLENMVEKTKEYKEWYAVATIGMVNGQGFDSSQGSIPYINPRCALINRNMYFQFKPFIKHGAPWLESMIDLKRQNKSDLLINFNYAEYIIHEKLGTVKRTGGFHL